MAEWWEEAGGMLNRAGKFRDRVGMSTLTGAGAGALGGAAFGGVGAIPGALIGGGLGLVSGLAGAIDGDAADQQAEAARRAEEDYIAQLDAQIARYEAMANPYTGTEPGAAIRANNAQVTADFNGAQRGLLASLAARGMMGSGEEALGMGAIAAGRAGALSSGANALRADWQQKGVEWEDARRRGVMGAMAGQRAAAAGDRAGYEQRASDIDSSLGGSAAGFAQLAGAPGMGNLGSMLPQPATPAAPAATGGMARPTRLSQMGGSKMGAKGGMSPGFAPLTAPKAPAVGYTPIAGSASTANWPTLRKRWQ